VLCCAVLCVLTVILRALCAVLCCAVCAYCDIKGSMCCAVLWALCAALCLTSPVLLALDLRSLDLPFLPVFLPSFFVYYVSLPAVCRSFLTSFPHILFPVSSLLPSLSALCIFDACNIVQYNIVLKSLLVY
jgi:hypothetical protein